MSYEQPEFWFKGKAAIVTGGAQGLGFAAAQKLAEHGARVYIADRDEALAQQSEDSELAQDFAHRAAADL